MVTEYIASLKAAWELAKAIKASSDAINDAHLKLQIAELISALAEAKIAATESEEKIAELEKRLRLKTEMAFDGKVYYKSGPNGKREGPWCPRCFDADGKEVRLQPGYEGSWLCRNCDNVF